MMREILSNPWVFAAVSGLCGAILTILAQRVLNKRGLFTYSVSHIRVGMFAEDPAFGSVKVTWNENPIANLYISTIELRNDGRPVAVSTRANWREAGGPFRRSDAYKSSHAILWRSNEP